MGLKRVLSTLALALRFTKPPGGVRRIWPATDVEGQIRAPCGRTAW